MENEKLEVEKIRAEARKLQDEAKDKEFDSFVGTQLERERLCPASILLFITKAL